MTWIQISRVSKKPDNSTGQVYPLNEATLLCDFEKKNRDDIQLKKIKNFLMYCVYVDIEP